MCADRPVLRRRLKAARRHGAEEALERLTQDIEASAERARCRRAQAPSPTFPPELPITQHRDALARALAAHQVVIVAGETGSGKTTQLPKLCLSLGRGAAGQIGLTQPRRIAARAVSSRIAEELDTVLGQTVGYKVRFRDRTNPEGYIKVMTDGILLAELQGDRSLDRYDTLIVDEAHERSLNIDFLLGYLKRLLPKRPDLKVIITSATIDTERFARFFGDAPIVEVTGRTYPVELRYRPLEGEDPDEADRDLQRAILDGIDEVSSIDRGDVLVFLAGEREIRETAEALRKHHPPHTEILPLYARLSAAEQSRVFHPGGRRRIVLATNVAETSLTVPGIRYVIDPGRARISRYGQRSQVQRLPIEKISQASADQRAGRCGRVSAGVCVRLYSETDYLSRPWFTDPEIKRTHLAAVILQMQTLGLGAVEAFPFIEPPGRKQVSDGYRLLWELGAVDEKRSITPLGRDLARLPVDPRIARMMHAAAAEGCMREVLVLAAALSIQDPRERPLDAQAAADEKHRRDHDPHSDFVALLNLWRRYIEHERHLSKSRLRRWCRDEYLSFVRMREWRETHDQLHGLMRERGWRVNDEPADYAALHRAVLTGLVAYVARKDERHEYRGARGGRIFVFPGSGLFKRAPQWIVAAELVETSRLYARTVARIDPDWVERVAPHLVKRHYDSPHWEKRPAQVAAYESVTLYGLTMVAGRKVNYGPIEPAVAREVFIRRALVEGDYDTDAPFFRHNRELVEEVETLEHKTRRRDVLIDEETLYAFYDERIPEGIHSGATFERWRVEVEREDPRRLFLTRERLMRHGAEGATGERFPDRLRVDGLDLALQYHFEPGASDDGVTAVIPFAVLNQLSENPFQWLVPGLLEEKIAALLKSLPKAKRRAFVPVPEYARACREALTPYGGGLYEALSAQLSRMTGVDVGASEWPVEALPAHLRMNFRVVDEDGRTVDSGRDLSVLRTRHGDRARERFDALSSRSVEREGLERWDFETLPDRVEIDAGGPRVRGFTALVDEGDSAAIRVLDAPARAAAFHRAGVRRLFMLALAAQRKFLAQQLPLEPWHGLIYAQVQRRPAPGPGEALPTPAPDAARALEAAVLEAAFDRVFIDQRPPVRTREEFERRLEAGRGEIVAQGQATAQLVAEILEQYQGLCARLDELPAAWRHAVEDVSEQLDHLVYGGFIAATPHARLAHYPRFLKAIALRLAKLADAPARDRERTELVRRYWRPYVERLEALDGAGETDEALQAYRWMLEEYRVSLFAQELKTAAKVSSRRLEKQWVAVGA